MWFETLSSVLIVSLVSLVGVFTLSISTSKLKKWLLFFVSFAAGAMLGDAFLHLLPGAIEEGIDSLHLGIYALTGLTIFFVLEKIIFWRHCHLPTTEEHPHPFGKINLIGDGLHNFIDGVIIAGSFLISAPLGVTTTIAVLLHEIPQEIGDFSILLHAGYSKKRALLFNVLSASLAVLGATAVLLLGDVVEVAAEWLVPFTIGGFLYIAAADLLPTIHREENTKRSFIQLVFFMLGIFAMAALLLLE